MEKVRIGVIGVGVMGSHHATYLNKGEIPGAELAAICDLDPKRREWAKNTFGEKVRVFETAEAMFAAKCVDAIMIATPHYFHPPLAIQGFEHGLHVLSEKPAGVYTRQVREMNERAAKSGRVFGIMFQDRTQPVLQKARDLISSGELGELRRTNWIATSWFRSQAYYDSGGWRASWAGEGGGVLLNQCPHNLDIWQWTCGLPQRVRAFCAFGKRHDIEVEDEVTAYVEYANGATGLFVTTTGESPGSNRFEIAGDRGKMVVENGKLSFWRTRVPVGQFLRETKAMWGSPECWTCEIPAPGSGGTHQHITRNWVEAILKGTALVAPGVEGMNGLQLSNAMLLSAWTEQWVSLPVDEEAFLAQLEEKIKTSKYRKSGGATGGDMDVTKSFNR